MLEVADKQLQLSLCSPYYVSKQLLFLLAVLIFLWASLSPSFMYLLGCPTRWGTWWGQCICGQLQEYPTLYMSQEGSLAGTTLPRHWCPYYMAHLYHDVERGFYPMPAQTETSWHQVDTSRSWGCAALLEKQWFQLQWSSLPSFASIASKELVPIVQHMGSSLKGKTNLDNEVVVCVINSGSCKKPHLTHMRWGAFLYWGQI